MLSYPRQAAPVGLAAAPGVPAPWGIPVPTRIITHQDLGPNYRRAPQFALLLSPVRTVGVAGYAVVQGAGSSSGPRPDGPTLLPLGP